MPIYMKYGSIKGDVTEVGHQGWIEVGSVKWFVQRLLTSPTGASADRESTAPTLNPVIVTKSTDISSPRLLNEALQGEGQGVTIDFCKTAGGKLELYMSYKLENCLISSYAISSDGDRPSESVVLNFTKVEFKNVNMGAAGETGSPDSVTYDVAKAKVV